ncbi:hypothetical protein ATK30_6870 [Amycolatopsis echigonensis]|uniref:DUF6879 domain-containing protein n=1 Tax=Amycolatopsis echigonensis TaxID=2576905 RepID=A0A2N3WPY2_9PSEU|nr:DUF6879 family protein [Amycolatopsis niigatensis]PKV95937.1 hypothetical protein ATK30_6870 [Amycolatopsis niigatensis]
MTDPNQQLDLLFGSFARSSWRWECQGDYAIDAAALQRWRDGRPADMTRKAPWLQYIREITAAGKTFDRVRMLTEPPTEYLRWLVEQTDSNIDAGEDIRWITQSAAAELGMPSYDFYLFDDSRVAIMRFGPDKLLSDLEIRDEPDVVARHRAYRDAVWPRAMPHSDYYAPRST